MRQEQSVNDFDHKADLDRHFAWFQGKLSPRLAKFFGWLRRPSSMWVRVPLALLLVAGGVFSFLPVLGLWMLPLGLVLIAQDVPLLQKPMSQLLGWMERKWRARQQAKANAVARQKSTKDSASDSAEQTRR
jgi:hypothetical protein